jgi:hypothetical protein
MAFINDRVLDLGLNVLDTEATHININSSEPATYTAATSTVALGTKNFGAGAAFGAPAARTPSGRKVTSVAITDGSVTATGTASHWSVTDNTNSRLLAASSLGATQSVTSGNAFSMAAFDIGIPGP